MPTTRTTSSSTASGFHSDAETVRLILEPRISQAAPRGFTTGFWLPYRARTLDTSTLETPRRILGGRGLQHGQRRPLYAAHRRRPRCRRTRELHGQRLGPPNALMFAKFDRDVTAEIPEDDRFVRHPDSKTEGGRHVPDAIPRAALRRPPRGGPRRKSSSTPTMSTRTGNRSCSTRKGARATRVAPPSRTSRGGRMHASRRRGPTS